MHGSPATQEAEVNGLSGSLEGLSQDQKIWGGSCVVEFLPSMHEALAAAHYHKPRKKKRKIFIRKQLGSSFPLIFLWTK